MAGAIKNMGIMICHHITCGVSLCQSSDSSPLLSRCESNAFASFPGLFGFNISTLHRKKWRFSVSIRKSSERKLWRDRTGMDRKIIRFCSWQGSVFHKVDWLLSTARMCGQNLSLYQRQMGTKWRTYWDKGKFHTHQCDWTESIQHNFDHKSAPRWDLPSEIIYK